MCLDVTILDRKERETQKYESNGATVKAFLENQIKV